MANPQQEKRLYPRIKANFKVDISKGISAESNDLSEGGLSLRSADIISSPIVTVQVSFPDAKFKTEARLIWKRDIESGGSMYGVEFVDLDAAQKAELRQEIIRAQASGLLSGIEAPEIKELVTDFFLKDILDYSSKMIKLCSRMNKAKEYSDELEAELDQLNTQILLKGYCLEELIADEFLMRKVKDSFRQLAGAWIYKSSIVKRSFEKPRGYPADYAMLEMVYDNKPVSKNIVGEYFDRNFLKGPLAVAMRMRKDRFRELLQYYINTAALSKINILNFACGPCREVRELLPRLTTKAQVTFTCVDWDEEALRYSQSALLPIAPKNVNFKFAKEDITNILTDESSAESLGRQNIIYSIGLFDYLPNIVMKKLVYVLFNALRLGGKLIFTHKNREKTFPAIPPDWASDWKFLQRNKEEVTALLHDCGISGFSLSSEADDFGYIHYFTLTRTVSS